MENNEWIEIKQEIQNLKKFENKGDYIEGVLINKETFGNFNNILYTLSTSKGEIKFFGSVILNNKLKDVPNGSFIKIVFNGKTKGLRYNYYDFSVYVKSGDIK